MNEYKVMKNGIGEYAIFQKTRHYTDHNWIKVSTLTYNDAETAYEAIELMKEQDKLQALKETWEDVPPEKI